MTMEIKDVSILFAQENMNEHCNYFRWFADDDDDDITSTIRATAAPRTDSTTKEINDLRRRVGEHDRRLQMMEKIFKGMTYVIVELGT
ncbi:hypothetical protein CsSME_00033106 [Camellia sinensis var. sinensis]